MSRRRVERRTARRPAPIGLGLALLAAAAPAARAEEGERLGRSLAVALGALARDGETGLLLSFRGTLLRRERVALSVDADYVATSSQRELSLSPVGPAEAPFVDERGRHGFAVLATGVLPLRREGTARPHLLVSAGLLTLRSHHEVGGESGTRSFVGAIVQGGAGLELGRFLVEGFVQAGSLGGGDERLGASIPEEDASATAGGFRAGVRF